MNIIWNKNPLYTVVELTEAESKELWYKIRMEQLEEMMFSAHHTLNSLEWFNKAIKPRTLEEAVEIVKKELNPDYWCTDDKSDLDRRVDELHAHYVEELKGVHVGNCTCVPCSCSKCHAETLVGVNTMKGIDKHSAYKIDGAFGKDNERTIDEAIAHLESYEPVFNGTGGWKSKESFDAHVPRWKAEAAHALTWLKNYREEHGEALQSGISRQIAKCDSPATTGDAGTTNELN